MPRYYLNIRDRGVLIEDPEGDEASDLSAIRRIAVDVISDIMRRPNSYGVLQLWERYTFEITDDDGQVVLHIPFADPPEIEGRL